MNTKRLQQAKILLAALTSPIFLVIGFLYLKLGLPIVMNSVKMYFFNDKPYGLYDLLLLMFAIGGILGLIGFGWGTFSSQNLPKWKALTIVGLILTGIFVSAPLWVSYFIFPWLFFVMLFANFSGLILIVILIKTNPSLKFVFSNLS